MEDKIYKSLDEMIKANIEKEMYIHIASTMPRANAAVNSIVRCFQDENPEFTFSVTAMVGNLHAIALTGIAKHVIAAFLGDNCLKARPNKLYKDVVSEGKPFTLEQVSMLTLIQRLMGGALNLKYVTTNSLVHSDIINEAGKYAYGVNDPQDDKEKITLIKSLFPDITIVHGVCADSYGNVILNGPLGEGKWGCLAAKKGVLVTVEKIVSNDFIKANIEKVMIPGDRVIGVCEVPFGAYPQGMKVNKIINVDDYYDDYEFFDEVRMAVRTDEGKKEWLDKWINIPGGNPAYIDKIKREKSEKICSHYINNEVKEPFGEVTIGEKLIALASRAIIQKVKQNGYRTILAGIGFAHIAAWIALRTLEDEGIHVRIMSELGFYGMVPYYGDVYLFSQRHAEKCEEWSSVPEILGCQVGYGHKCLGVLGAAEVDKNGNINTTFQKNGSYMTGSGGANDIASVTDSMVIVAAGKNRIVDKVSFITSPGVNIKNVVTTFGMFQRENSNEDFKLKTWYLNGSEYNNPEDAVNELTEWHQENYHNLINEEEVTLEERRLIWSMDPQGVYR